MIFNEEWCLQNYSKRWSLIRCSWWYVTSNEAEPDMSSSQTQTLTLHHVCTPTETKPQRHVFINNIPRHHHA